MFPFQHHRGRTLTDERRPPGDGQQVVHDEQDEGHLEGGAVWGPIILKISRMIHLTVWLFRYMRGRGDLSM